jgi:hypothetical protein
MAVCHQRSSLCFFLLGDQVYQVASSFVHTRMFFINSIEYFSRGSYILAIQNVTNVVTVVDFLFDIFFSSVNTVDRHGLFFFFLGRDWIDFGKVVRI